MELGWVCWFHIGQNILLRTAEKPDADQGCSETSLKPEYQNCRKYKITRQENNQIRTESIPVIRNANKTDRD